MHTHAVIRFSLVLLALWGSAGASAAPARYDEVLSMDVWEPYAPDFAVKEFKAYIKSKYRKNIHVEVRYIFSPNDFFDQVRANKTDIISPSHNLLKDERYDFIDKELIIPLDKKMIPHLSGVDPAYLTNKFVTHKGRLYGAPFASGAYSLLYKKTSYPEPPTSWNVLWDKASRGKYAISHDFYESNIYITALAMGIPPSQMSDVGVLDKPAFREKLKALLKYANFWQGVPHDSDVKHSQLTTAWGFSHSVHPDPKNEWFFTQPKEGITVWTDYLAVTRAVKRSPFARKLAMEWVNFTLSRDFQKRVTIDLLKCISAVPAAYEGLEKTPAAVDPREKDFLTKNAIHWPLLSVRNRNGLKVIYGEVLEELKLEKTLATK